MKLSNELDELSFKYNGDIRTITLLYPDVRFDKYRMIFLSKYTECCIEMHNDGYFEEIQDGYVKQVSLCGYIKSISLTILNDLSIYEFTMIEPSKNISKIVRLLKEDCSAIHNKCELLSLIQPKLYGIV